MKAKPLAQGIFLNYFTIPGLPQKRIILVDDIIEQTCKYYHITRSEMMSKSRKEQFRFPRQVACYLIREMTSLVWTQIAEEFDFNHATAMHSYNVISNMIEKYPKKRQDVDYIRGMILSKQS